MIIWMLINSMADGLVLNVAMCFVNINSLHIMMALDWSKMSGIFYHLYLSLLGLLQIWKLQVVVRLDAVYLSIPRHSCSGMYSFSLQLEVSWLVY